MKYYILTEGKRTCVILALSLNMLKYIQLTKVKYLMADKRLIFSSYCINNQAIITFDCTSEVMNYFHHLLDSK